MYIPVVIVMIWIVIPTFEILMAWFSTDIIDKVCIPIGVYSSYAMAKTMGFSIIFVGYLLPLALMIFFYSRIVHSLCTKVTNRYHHVI